jgi:hypothetical protein
MLVYYDAATDPFARDLRRDFDESLLKSGLLEPLPPQSFSGQSGEARPAAFNNPVLNICNQRPDVILYAGREIDLKTFVKYLGNRSCVDLLIRIVAAGTGFGTIRPLADELKRGGISIAHASSVGGERWVPGSRRRPTCRSISASS